MNLLLSYADLVDPTSRALDIGCGQGRNSLFLARKNQKVDALDPSIEAIRAVRAAARREGLQIHTIHGGFEDIEPVPAVYGAILVFGLIPDLSRTMVTALVSSIETILAPGGVLFMTAFGTWDPSFERHERESTETADNSLRSLGGPFRTYLKTGELVSLFPSFDVVHSWEGLGPEHRHGDGPIERPGRAEAVFRRPCVECDSPCQQWESGFRIWDFEFRI
ncbi:MAG: class I SAM-dependent methyltransferase [Acidobacteriota bacterium]